MASKDQEKKAMSRHKVHPNTINQGMCPKWTGGEKRKKTKGKKELSFLKEDDKAMVARGIPPPSVHRGKTP